MTLFFDSDKSREWLPQILFFTILSLSLIIHNLKHQNRVFIFYHLNSKFWVFEWWKQTSKTKPNIASFVEPTSFGWWIMKTEWYHSIFGPSKQALRHSSPSFHILKSVHDSLIINATSYISFNVHNQTIIHPLNVEQNMEQNLILLA